MRSRKLICCASVCSVLVASLGCRESQTPTRSQQDKAASSPAPSTPAQPADSALEPDSGMPPGHPPVASTPPAGATTQPAAPATTAPTLWKGKGVAWVLPDGWNQVTGSGMRFATLKPAAGGPEVAISHFPGDVGGMLANVNRWRGQIGLPPVTEAQLPEQTSEFKVGDIKATLVDLGGEKPEDKCCLALSIPHAGQTWFAKMVGVAKDVRRHEEDFKAFAKSIRFEK